MIVTKIFINKLRSLRYIFLKRNEIFKKAFINNTWRSNESKSGKGSEIQNTKNVRAELPKIIYKYNIESIIDIPCGDFNWMQEIVHVFRNYYGCDLVKEIIVENKLKFQKDNIRFLELDILQDQLFKVDMILCRDLFIHLSFKDIKCALLNIKNSDSKYLLASTYNISKNKDIKTGMFRPVNLCLPPFSLPKPELIIYDGYGQSNSHSSKKYLALWYNRIL